MMTTTTTVPMSRGREADQSAEISRVSQSDSGRQRPIIMTMNMGNSASEHRHGQLCWLCGKELGHREHCPSLPTRLPACEDGCQGLQSVVVVVEKKLLRRALRRAAEPLPHVFDEPAVLLVPRVVANPLHVAIGRPWIGVIRCVIQQLPIYLSALLSQATPRRAQAGAAVAEPSGRTYP